MSFNVGELTAYIDLDDSRFDRKLDRDRDELGRFVSKKHRTTLDIDTTQAQSKLGALGGLVSQHSQQIQSAGMKMTAGVTLPYVIGSALMVESASSLNEAQNKVNVVFGESSDAVLKWGESAADAIGQSERQALSAAGTFGNLFVSMGMGDQQSAEMSMSLTNLASDLASFNDIDPTEALDALRSGLVGETEPMRRLGVNMNEATLRAKALEMGLDATGATLDPLVKAQAAYALIMEQTTTAQGDFARTSDDVANAQRSIKAEAEDMAAAWGEELLPVVKETLAVAKPVLGFFKDLPGPVKQAAIVLGGLFAVIGPSLWMIGAMSEGLKTLKSAFGAIRAALTTADTAAIAANTAAVHANTTARVVNAKMPAVGSGVAPQLMPGAAGAGGLGAGAATASVLAAVASAAVGTAMTYYALTYEQPADAPNAAMTGAKHAGVGRTGAASRQQVLNEVRPEVERYAAGVSELNEVIDTMNKMKPSARTVGATARLGRELDAIADEYPELRDRVKLTKQKLEEGAPAFEEAAKAAAALAEEERKAYDSMQSFNEAMMKAAVGLGDMPTATQAEYAAQNDQLAGLQRYQDLVDKGKIDPLAGVPENTDNPFKAGQVGFVKPKAFAAGGEFVTSGPELILVGDNPGGRETVKVTPGASGSGVNINLSVRADFLAMPTRQQVRRLTRMVGDEMSSELTSILAASHA